MYINGVQITGVQPKPIELTQAEYDALPEEQKQNGSYIITDAVSEPLNAENVGYDNTTSGLVATDVQAAIDELANGGGGGGGHIIVNDSGTSMTQRSELQFNGVYTSDNSTDDTTEVNIVREMTESQYSQLSAAEKKGIIITDTSTPSVIGLTGDMVMYDNINTVNDKIDEISTMQDEDIVASTAAWPGSSLVFSNIEPVNAQLYHLTAVASGAPTYFIDYFIIIRVDNNVYASKISGQDATFTYDSTEKTLAVTLPTNSYYVYSFKKVKSNH